MLVLKGSSEISCAMTRVVVEDHLHRTSSGAPYTVCCGDFTLVASAAIARRLRYIEKKMIKCTLRRVSCLRAASSVLSFDGLNGVRCLLCV